MWFRCADPGGGLKPAGPWPSRPGVPSPLVYTNQKACFCYAIALYFFLFFTHYLGERLASYFEYVCLHIPLFVSKQKRCLCACQQQSVSTFVTEHDQVLKLLRCSSNVKYFNSIKVAALPFFKQSSTTPLLMQMTRKWPFENWHCIKRTSTKLSDNVPRWAEQWENVLGSWLLLIGVPDLWLGLVYFYLK